jgi:hypothetical protein
MNYKLKIYLLTDRIMEITNRLLENGKKISELIKQGRGR